MTPDRSASLLRVMVGFRKIVLLLYSLAAIACAPTPSPNASSPPVARSVVEWDDADSGTIDGVKFRLADWDAPETMPVGMRGGAKCEDERLLGRQMKIAMEQLTAGRPITIVARDRELDDFGREVLTLSLDGADLGAAAARAGILKPYVFENGEAIMLKPDWCP